MNAYTILGLLVNSFVVFFLLRCALPEALISLSALAPLCFIELVRCALDFVSCFPSFFWFCVVRCNACVLHHVLLPSTHVLWFDPFIFTNLPLVSKCVQHVGYRVACPCPIPRIRLKIIPLCCHLSLVKVCKMYIGLNRRATSLHVLP